MRKATLVASLLVLAGACVNPPLQNAPEPYNPPPLITSDANRLTLLGIYPEPLRMSYALYNCPDGRMVVGPLGWKTSSCASSGNVAPATAPSSSREPAMPTPPVTRPQTPVAPPAVRPIQTKPGSAPPRATVGTRETRLR